MKERRELTRTELFTGHNIALFKELVGFLTEFYFLSTKFGDFYPVLLY